MDIDNPFKGLGLGSGIPGDKAAAHQDCNSKMFHGDIPVESLCIG
jgi:hypothetical protein